jgi:hypothetical protein
VHNFRGTRCPRVRLHEVPLEASESGAIELTTPLPISPHPCPFLGHKLLACPEPGLDAGYVLVGVFHCFVTVLVCGVGCHCDGGSWWDVLEQLQ